MKLRLQPIRVYCLHHVSDTYDASYMWECDWTNTDVLKQRIIDLQKKGYTFISLPEAHEMLKYDWFRSKRYAVLTADDGFRTLINILPWLIEHMIPITLFVNPKYIIDGGIGENVLNRLHQSGGTISNSELYLNMVDINAFQSPLVTYAYHGYEHKDESKIDNTVFIKNLEECIESMHLKFPNIIQYYAHPYGITKAGNDDILCNKGITPIYINGKKNYAYNGYIDRELI